MLAAELREHPEYPHVFWKLEAEKKGRLPVAKHRGGPFNIYYEVHGRGPIRIVWIMGLGSLAIHWQRQTKDFGHTDGDKYSCLINDNRGIGRSDTPVMRYSTSEMAKDTIELVDHVGWTGMRQLHVIGISMGGMIAQEMALLIPDRIASLSLISTAAGLYNTIGFFENLRNRINLFIPRSIDLHIAKVKVNLYTNSFLHQPDELEPVVQRFPTNGDRLGATELTKRSQPELFNRTGFIAQALAAGWHKKSPEQLEEMATKVGRERIQVMHGTEDRMITFPHGEGLLTGLGGEEGGVTKRFVEGVGHVIPIERRREFKEWMEILVEKTEKMNKSSG